MRHYDSAQHARECLAELTERYIHGRPHWAPIPVEGGDPLTPADVCMDGLVTKLPMWQGWAREAKAKLETMLDHREAVG